MARELDRASRTGSSLVLAFVDIDGLKQVNDSQGHLAGDALLHRTGDALRCNVRAYDIVVRYGGDEFVCAMPNLSPTTAKSRLQTVAATLAADDDAHSITFGLAEAQAGDTLTGLIARADNDLLEARLAKHTAAVAAPPQWTAPAGTAEWYDCMKGHQRGR